MNIKERREAIHMTQAELAKMVGVEPSTMCLYESGKRSPKIDTAFKIAKALGCTVDELIKEQ